MQKSKIKQISLAVCLVFTPISIYAAGLGKLNTLSGLGEPLRAEIEVFATPEELTSLAAAIASEEAYAAQGVSRLGVHNNIRVDVAKSASGKPILTLQTSEPIKDPFLDMIIQMDWENGRLQREYTVLLDPPTYKPADVNSESVAVLPPSTTSDASSDSTSYTAEPTQGEVRKSSTKKQRKLKKRSVAKPDVDMTVEVAADAQEATTKSGDTLTAIAKEMQLEGVSLDQMLAGLYKANQDAFIKGNINRLKIGQIIKVPTKESLTSISDSQARKVVRVHSANWNAYRNTMAGAVANAPASNELEEKQSSSGKITTAEDKAAATKPGPQDVVKLSAGEKDGKSADGKLTALQEEMAAREKSLNESKERATDLEKQIQEMQKVLALKNKSMADKQAEAGVEVKTPEVTVPEIKPEVPPVPAEVKPAETSATIPPTPEVAVVPEVKVEEPKPVEPVAVKPAPPPIEVPVEEPSFLDGFLGGDNNLPLIGGGLGLALLGAGWMFLRNKRKKNLDSFERGILTSGGLRANTVFGNTTSNTSTSDTSFLTDFAQSVDGGMIDTNDVDPIAEAEVYMAYGRGAQAEEILKDAIVKEPKRYELHLKLLEMYAENKDTGSFEAIAGELYTTLGADDPVWAKVATLGAKLEPANPLYDLSKIALAAVAVSQVSDDIDFSKDIDSLDEDTLSSSSTLDIGDVDNSLDFSLDDEQSIEASSVVSNDFSVSDDNIQDIEFETFSQNNNALNVDTIDIGTAGAVSVEDDKLANADNNLMDMDFVLGDQFDIGNSEDAELVVAQETKSNFMEEMPAFDLSVPMGSQAEANPLDLTVADNKPYLTVADNKPFEALDFDMDFSVPGTITAETVAGEVAQKSELVSDFSFDLPDDSLANQTLMSEVTSEIKLAETSNVVELPKMSEPVVQPFDLSSINLDLDNPTIQPTLAQAETVSLSGGTSSSAIEPPDIEIKLDLVAVYMDMDDKVGARELLEEVMKEGGVMQKQRAQQLLNSLA